MSKYDPDRFPPPGKDATKEQWCEYWKKLDKHFETQSDSVLHHDWRCPIHGSRRTYPPIARANVNDSASEHDEWKLGKGR